MADNGSAVSLNAAANVINSTDPRLQQRGQRKWTRYLYRFSCFGAQKRTKRIVPASRTPDPATAGGNRANGAQPAGTSIQSTGIAPSLLAPPSSPASFTNSGNPSSVQSPNGNFSLSANICSPGGPTSTMFTTGPYAHENQLVSPPVFSTYTTEPSTAPFTPPPELAHLTTPSSPDVPFAQLLASSLDVKTSSSENGVTFSSGYVCASDLQAAYQLQPGSPASQLVSPKPGVSSNGGVSFPFPGSQFPHNWNSSWSGQDSPFPKYEPSKSFNQDNSTPRSFVLSQDSTGSSFTTSAELDQFPQTSHSGGKQHDSSPEADASHDNARNNHQNKYIEPNKPDVEQIEAYRASFGFSADEITTSNYAFSEVLGGQKNYGESGKQDATPEGESSDLVLFDAANLTSPIDCDFLDSEGQSRNGYGQYGDNSRASDSDSLKFGDLEFDKKDGTSASGSIIEKWARYREKLRAQKEQEEYHVIHLEGELQRGTLS